MAAFLKLLMQLPAILSILHEIIVLIEKAFPNATGAQKLNAAVDTVNQLLPQVQAVAGTPVIQTAINFIVGLLNRPGGAFDAAKTDKPADTNIGG